MTIVNNIINGILDFFDTALGTILFFLPDSPFRPHIEELANADWLGYVAYFVPLGQMLIIGYSWLGGVLIFYTYQIIMRLIKVIK